MTAQFVMGDDVREVLAQWAAARIPAVGDAANFGPCAPIGLVSERGALLAVAVYHNWIERHAHVEVSFATSGPGWASRAAIRGFLAVPFIQYGVRTLGAICRHKGETERINMLPRLGFVREGTKRDFFGAGDHAAIYGMTRRDWERKWCNG